MYTDNRLCTLCCDNGLFRDGENYCTECKNYLCLACAKAHGQKCRIRQNMKQNIHYACSGYSNCQQITTDIEKSDLYPARTEKQLKIENFEDVPKSVSLENDHKISIQLKTETLQLKEKREENTCNSNIRKEKAPDQRNTLSSQKSGEKRQNYSARGGIVIVTNVSTCLEKAKFQRCGDHPEMTVENFCNFHNDLCCEDCLNEDHRQCVVQPIDEVAHGIFSNGVIDKAEKDFKDLQMTHHILTKKYEKIIELMRSNGRSMSNENIEPKGRKTNVFDMSKEKHLKRMLTKCIELNDNVSLSIAEIQSAKESGSEIQAFITLQKNKKTLANARSKFKELTQTFDMAVAEEERNAKRTIGYEERKTTREMDSDKNGTDSGNDGNQNHDVKITNNDNTLSNKTVIGEVILQTFEENIEENSKYDETVKKDKEIQENDDIKSYIEEIDYNGIEENQNEESENGCHNELASSQVKDKPKSVKKFVEFFKTSPSSVFRKVFKDRVKTNGLVAEYYLNDDDEDNGNIRVLRLQSAPPERYIKPWKETSLRPNSMKVIKHREMVEWQNRKILESVEHRTESTDFYETKHHSMVKQYRDNRMVTRRKTVELSESELKDERKTKQRYEINKLLRSRREMASFPQKKSNLSKSKQTKPSLTSKFTNFETTTGTQRLKQWIKQTEEMNEKYKNGNIKPFTDSSENEVEGTDAVDQVYAANVTNKLDDFNDKQENLPIFPLVTKEATVIKMVSPDDRQSSAKSRASDSEESLYNSQTYALPPKSQLFLTAEQIVRLPEDERVCEINSISCLPDGRIVVSDFSNIAIKMFRVGWGKSSVLKLDAPPHGVTVVSNSILAVISGLAHDRLLVVSVGQFLSIKRSYKTNCACKAISSYESHIYLLCIHRYKTEVRILTTDGVVSIRLDLGHAVLSPQSIAVNALDGLVYIADENRGILTIEMRKIVSRTCDRNIESYLDIEADRSNNLYVCTKNPCGIYEMSYDGKHLMPILLGYGVENVKAIAYDSASNSLIVGCDKTETIQIYKINDTVNLKKNIRH